MHAIHVKAAEPKITQQQWQQLPDIRPLWKSEQQNAACKRPKR